jgi:hypothetical protein
MRHDHSIQDSGSCRVRRVQIKITVEVHQAEIRLSTDEAGDDTDRDRAIATENDRNRVIAHNGLNLVGDAYGRFEDTVEVLAFGMLRVGSEGNLGQVAEVDQ